MVRELSAPFPARAGWLSLDREALCPLMHTGGRACSALEPMSCPLTRTEHIVKHEGYLGWGFSIAPFATASGRKCQALPTGKFLTKMKNKIHLYGRKPLSVRNWPRGEFVGGLPRSFSAAVSHVMDLPSRCRPRRCAQTLETMIVGGTVQQALSGPDVQWAIRDRLNLVG